MKGEKRSLTNTKIAQLRMERWKGRTISPGLGTVWMGASSSLEERVGKIINSNLKHLRESGQINGESLLLKFNSMLLLFFKIEGKKQII